MQSNKNKVRQLGFGVVGTLAIVAVGVLLGFGGWYVWQAQINTETSKTQLTTERVSGSQATASEVNTTPYMHIKELDITLKLSETLRGDVIYTARQRSSGAWYAAITTKSLESQSGGTCNTDSAPLGVIVRAHGSFKDVFGDQPVRVDNERTFKFGTDTYVYMDTNLSPQASCSTDDDIARLASQQYATFLQDFKTVQLGED